MFTTQAVAAATAEGAHELLPLASDIGPQLVVQSGRLVHEGQPFVQLPLPLNAPDGDQSVELAHEGHGRLCVGDEAAGQALHAHEANIVLLTGGKQLYFLILCQIAHGIL